MPASLNVLLNNRSRKTLKTTSIVLIVVGIIGIVLPQFLSIAIALFAGWLLLLAGSIAMFITWQGFRDRWVAWLKPFVLVAVGLLILLNPTAGTAALGLMLAIYFLFDGFSGVGSAWEMRPQQGWGWLMFNGASSLLLAMIFIIGWPFTSAWLIGLFIGISLFIDGVSLLMLCLATRPVED
jgi:uncharacterized membrane protein HdeD (DUF308 family)